MKHYNVNTLSKTTDIFLTDGGLETTLVFFEGIDLPCFAAFDLLKDSKGYKILKDYYRRYLDIASNFKTNFILESPTWRSNPDWIQKIGYPISAIKTVNEKAIELLIELKQEYQNDIGVIVLSGCIGTRGDGYAPDKVMSSEQAKDYHKTQIQVFKNTEVDLISAITMNYVEEALGIVEAANESEIQSVISFTVETNGRLPSQIPLKDAIEHIDNSVSQPPLYYMINCAHPNHFREEMESGIHESWLKRIKGIRANASCKSHAELDQAVELDRGNPVDLGIQYENLKSKFEWLNVFGGCCGTDWQHVEQIITRIRTL